jgi:hypothetical protein
MKFFGGKEDRVLKAFHLEGGSGSNYKTDKGKVLSEDKQKPESMGPQAICHNDEENFQDHTEFGNQKSHVQASGYHCTIYIGAKLCYNRKLAFWI